MIENMDLRKKKYGKYFIYSFVWLLPISLASPYITARTWADLIMFIGIVIGIYDLVYIFYLRKKDNISFGRAFANALLYFHVMVLVLILYGMGEAFINGYTAKDWVGNSVSDTVYGIEAIINDGFGNLFRIVLAIPAFIYIFGYITISKIIEHNRSKK